MKIRLTNPITGRTRMVRARMTTDHPASSYGLPVCVLADGEAISPQDCILQNARIVALPRRSAQIAMLAQWQANNRAMLGITEAPP